jgi:DNA-binding IclR family transcriptional regulator
MLRRLDVCALAGKHLLDLVARTGESAHLAVLSGTKAVFVGRESASALLRVETTLGTAEPAYCTAVGKALLFDRGERELHKLFEGVPMNRFTATTITTVDELIDELVRSRARGYAYDDQELHAGVRCLAAPLRAYEGGIVAAIGISGPSARLTQAEMPNLAAAVCEVAGLLSAEMGARHSIDDAGPAAV